MWSFWERKLSRKKPFEKSHPRLTAVSHKICHLIIVLSLFFFTIIWQLMRAPPSTFSSTACTHFALLLRLYAVGGRDGSSCLRSMECFDPHTNKWSMCAPMAKRRGGVGVTTYNNFLYAVGGHDAPASNHCSRLSDCVERCVSPLESIC